MIFVEGFFNYKAYKDQCLYPMSSGKGLPSYNTFKDCFLYPEVQRNILMFLGLCHSNGLVHFLKKHEDKIKDVPKEFLTKKKNGFFKGLLWAYRNYLNSFDENNRHAAIGSYVNGMLQFLEDKNFHQQYVDEIIRDQRMFFTPDEGVYSEGIHYNYDGKHFGVLPKSPYKNQGLELNGLIITNLLREIHVYEGKIGNFILDVDMVRSLDFNKEANLIPWMNFIRGSRNMDEILNKARCHVGANWNFSLYKSGSNPTSSDRACGINFPWMGSDFELGLLKGQKGFIYFQQKTKKTETPSFFNAQRSFSPAISGRTWYKLLEGKSDLLKNHGLAFSGSHVAGNLKKKNKTKETLFSKDHDPLDMVVFLKKMLKSSQDKKLKAIPVGEKINVQLAMNKIHTPSFRGLMMLYLKEFSQDREFIKESLFNMQYMNLDPSLVEEALNHYEKESGVPQALKEKALPELRKLAMKLQGKIKLRGVFK